MAGGGGGGGSSYPISLSNARTETINPVFGANTQFFFDSPWASGGSNDQTSRLTGSATATSAAAEGNLQQGVSGSTSGSTEATAPTGLAALTSSPNLKYYILGGAGAIILTIWLMKRKL
jgi:hypothetical protein